MSSCRDWLHHLDWIVVYGPFRRFSPPFGFFTLNYRLIDWFVCNTFEGVDSPFRSGLIRAYPDWIITNIFNGIGPPPTTPIILGCIFRRFHVYHKFFIEVGDEQLLLFFESVDWFPRNFVSKDLRHIDRIAIAVDDFRDSDVVLFYLFWFFWILTSIF